MPLKSPRIRQKDFKSNGVLSPKNNSPRATYNKPLIAAQQLKKPLGYGQRVQKKSVGLAGKENKNNLQLARSKPKAILLTPSSSNASVTTTFSGEGTLSYTIIPNDIKEEEKPTVAAKAIVAPTPYLALKRQKSAVMMYYRSRKSLSQMDLKEALRTKNCQEVSLMPNSQALEPTGGSPKSLTIMLLKEADLICQAREVREVQSLHNIGRERFLRPGNLRIFNTLLLFNCRRQREEMRHLADQVEIHKRSFVKTRNQLHWTTTISSMNKRSNEILNNQVTLAQRHNAHLKSLYDELSKQFEEIKKEKQQLAEDLAAKEQDNENLQQLLQTTRKELFQSNNEQRLQLEQLTLVQRNYRDIFEENKDLIEQIEMNNLDLRIKTDNVMLLRELKETLEEKLLKLNKELDRCKSKHEEQSKLHCERIAEMERRLLEKDDRLKTLQNCFAATVGQRIRRCLNQSTENPATAAINPFNGQNVMTQNYLARL